MNKVSPHTRKSIRFRRWSRKAYAVFASLGKSISIGNLSVHMAGESLFRNVALIRLFISNQLEKEEDTEDPSSLLLSESLVNVTLVRKVSGEYPATYSNYSDYLS